MFKALSYIKTSLCCDDSLRVKSYQSHEFKFLAHRKTKIRQYIRRLKYSLMIKQSPLPILIVLAFTFVNSILWIVSLAEMCKIKHQSLLFCGRPVLAATALQVWACPPFPLDSKW